MDVGGETGPLVRIPDIAAACGADPIWIVEREDSEERMREVFREALEGETLSMVIVRKPCRDLPDA